MPILRSGITRFSDRMPEPRISDGKVHPVTVRHITPKPRVR